jgi:dCMP deaminase
MDKLNAYLEITKTLSQLSPCPRAKVGAVIIRPDRWSPLASGFNGTPRKSDKKLCGGHRCERDRFCIPSGRDTQIGCHHAEINAISNAAFEGVRLEGSWLICTAPPCLMCAKMIHHSGIAKVIYENTNPERWGEMEGVGYLRENNVEVSEITSK